MNSFCSNFFATNASILLYFYSVSLTLSYFDFLNSFCLFIFLPVTCIFRQHPASDSEPAQRGGHHRLGRHRRALHAHRGSHLGRLHRRRPDLFHRIWTGN